MLYGRLITLDFFDPRTQNEASLKKRNGDLASNVVDIWPARIQDFYYWSIGAGGPDPDQ
jgi:hypothetical protein